MRRPSMRRTAARPAPLAPARRSRPAGGARCAHAHALDDGPHGEAARDAVRDRLDEIARWTADYLRLAASTDPATWVATHGEPHTRNLLMTDDGTLLVDWESLRLAPRERDLRHLGAWSTLGEPALLEMFDLEWRLDEITQYADWFQASHPGNDSDRVALGGLRHELTRPAAGLEHSAPRFVRLVLARLLIGRLLTGP